MVCVGVTTIIIIIIIILYLVLLLLLSSNNGKSHYKYTSTMEPFVEEKLDTSPYLLQMDFTTICFSG